MRRRAVRGDRQVGQEIGERREHEPALAQSGVGESQLGRRPNEVADHEQVRVARVATIVFGALAVLLGIVFKGQNVAFMVGLAFAIAGSANFPPLLLSIVWKRFTTAGAVWSIVTGAVLSVLLIVLSPTIWVDLFHNPQAIFPLRNPAIVSMPAAFLVTWIVSVTDRSAEAAEDRRRFDLQFQHLNG